VLDRVIGERGQAPREIALDNGPELTSKALDQWAYERGVTLRFIEPGKPVQNAFIESFNGFPAGRTSRLVHATTIFMSVGSFATMSTG